MSLALEETRKTQTMRPAPGKILKKRIFVRIGEFHSGSKRATTPAGGMLEAGAGAKGSLNVRLPAASSPANMAAGALFEV